MDRAASEDELHTSVYICEAVCCIVLYLRIVTVMSQLYLHEGYCHA